MAGALVSPCTLSNTSSLKQLSTATLSTNIPPPFQLQSADAHRPRKEYFALMTPLCFGLFFPSGGTFLFASLSSEEDRDRICKALRSPGIDSKESIPRQPMCLAGWYDKLLGLSYYTGQPGYIGWRNQFLGNLKTLHIRAQL
jgi:hypothetical protein